MGNFSGFASAALQLGVQAVLIKPNNRGLRNVRVYDVETGPPLSLPDITAQATIEEVHHDDLEVTDHPVEQGAAITDHAFKWPSEIILKLGWSNSPSSSIGSGLIDAAVAFGAANNPAIRQVANVVGVVTEIASIADSFLNGAQVEQVAAVYQQLREMQARRALFDVVTSKFTYQNMICKSLSTSTDYKTANALIITMTCKQLILVNTQTLALEKDKQAEPEKTASTEDQGQKQLVDSPAPPAGGFVGKVTTLAKSAYDKLLPSDRYSFISKGGRIDG